MSLPSPTAPETAPSHPLGALRATLAEATDALRRRYAHDASHEAPGSPGSPGSPGPDTHEPTTPQPRSRRARLRRLARRALIVLLVVVILGASGLTWAWQATPSVVGLPAWVRGQDAARHAPYTPLAQVSPLVSKALVAIEDERFYQHHGIDTIGLLRAAWDDLRAGHIVEGGSTLTAQLAKNAYLHGYDRSLTLKAEDLLLAVKIERRYSKQQILEYYLNLVYFGEGAYGIGAAAQRYFGERASQLDLAQAALLAGLVQAPGYYDPWCHPEAAQDRQRVVLAHMLAQGMITLAQDQAAQHENFAFWAPGASRPHDAFCAA
ncbi:MAG TPA: transglycosylase domain-containing protein [Ktedonobacterales bacterium]|nr:transglycosylase domain-containing protein [Ktedonobacterales bacterium]